ncbi:transmembrane protein 45B-like [Senna tora]|uniref:Transmembrane protein 45B-like n=1 Tax=Senna tora TaxID=362788 RepID=A0A834XJ73_9FABA|nr:transmembrane protein 45B-like [Senna tora]
MDGHVVLGFGFILIGLWHLFNHIKLHTLNTTPTTNTLWFPFPSPKLKYLELLFILASSTIFIALELFISPSHHHPFDPHDGSIPSNHLHNFEHASMSLAFFVYAGFALALDLVTASSKETVRAELTLLLAGIAFAQQLLLIHFHTTDHVGPEGEYHFFAQVVVLVSLATTLVGIGLRGYSFLVCFVRSVSILFQGVWLMVIGFVLWTPSLIPKGCFMGDDEEGRHVVRCEDDVAVRRAVSVVNAQFSWFFVGVVVFVMSFYLVLIKWYGGEKRRMTMKEYGCVGEGGVVMKDDDVESQRKSIELIGNVRYGDDGVGKSDLGDKETKQKGESGSGSEKSGASESESSSEFESRRFEKFGIEIGFGV